MRKKKNDDLSILNNGLVMEGTLTCKGNLIIKGIVRGVLSGETIVIGEEGAVYADTTTDNMTVGGYFEGELRASNQLIILSTGNLKGEAMCRELVVEPGGVLNAKVTRISPEEADAMKNVAADKMSKDDF